MDGILFHPLTPWCQLTKWLRLILLDLGTRVLFFFTKEYFLSVGRVVLAQLRETPFLSFYTTQTHKQGFRGTLKSIKSLNGFSES